VEADSAIVLNSILASLDDPATHPRAPLAALPYYPMLNFLSARPLATRFLTILPLEETPNRNSEVLAGIDADPNTRLIYGLQHMTGISRLQDYAPGLFDGLVARYQLGRVFSHEAGGAVFAAMQSRRPVERPAETSVHVVYDFAEELAVAELTSGVPSAEPRGRGGIGSAMVSLESWAFESPVISFAATPDPGVSRLIFGLDPADLENSLAAFERSHHQDQPVLHLKFKVAMNPDKWRHFLPAALHYRVVVDNETLFDLHLDPRRNLEDRKWVDADIALGTSGVREVRFEISTDNRYGTATNMAGFANPQLIARPASRTPE
jgi:hypothetical protein